MNKELHENIKAIIRRMNELYKNPDMEERCRGLKEALDIVERTADKYSCTNCLHWGGKYLKHCEEPWFEQCGRQVEDKFIPKEGVMDG